MRTEEHFLKTQESLDPADWAEARKLAHQMMDDMLDYMASIRERPAWSPIPEDIRETFSTPLPHQPEGAEPVYEEFKQTILAYPLGDIHPRFFSWVNGPGSVAGMLASMLANTMNPNSGGANHAANLVEQQVINWCKEFLDFPENASGVLTSGGSMANLIALAVARHWAAKRAGVNMRKEGMQSFAQRLRLYCSSETHSSVQRALETLGMGSDSLCAIPVNANFQLDPEALVAAIKADREAGILPFCIVGTSGTTNTGSIDPLDTLADICAREQLWFHVDGAIGAVAALAPEIKPKLKGIERADSIAFDMHKWLFMNYAVGCVLVRNADLHRETFSLTPAYLKHAPRGAASGDLWFSEMSIELTREFRALKIWMLLKEFGSAKFGRMMLQTMTLAAYLAEQIDRAPQLERLAPAPLHIVVFRYVDPALSAEDLNKLNAEIVMEIQESGIAVPGTTTIHGKTAIRACINNYRTRHEDLDMLLQAVVSTGQALTQH